MGRRRLGSAGLLFGPKEDGKGNRQANSEQQTKFGFGGHDKSPERSIIGIGGR
jgi:hypothetical protein